jgi:hypothetical protein
MHKRLRVLNECLLCIIISHGPVFTSGSCVCLGANEIDVFAPSVRLGDAGYSAFAPATLQQSRKHRLCCRRSERSSWSFQKMACLTRKNLYTFFSKRQMPIGKPVIPNTSQTQYMRSVCKLRLPSRDRIPTPISRKRWEDARASRLTSRSTFGVARAFSVPAVSGYSCSSFSSLNSERVLPRYFQ